MDNNNNNDNTYSTKIATACILLSVANADHNLEKNEINTINKILQDFFSIEQESSNKLIIEATNILDKATDLFQFGKQLNKEFTKDDKIDFICCIYEVAYSDGVLHYLEHHTIKKIANILNLHLKEIIAAKSEIESYLN